MVEQASNERDRWQVSSRWGRMPMLWHCLNCGECLDKTILRNRALCVERPVDDRRARIWHQIKRLCREVAA